MDWHTIHIKETDSTNRWLREYDGDEENVVVWADYQTAGRGQGTNRWESEPGKNLLFSVLLHPTEIPAGRQFQVSMAVSLAVCEALTFISRSDDISIKWPNDIYWRDQKMCGMLIENTLHGTVIRDSIAGIGLNVNQQQFHSDAPNPVSLRQICGHDTDRQQVLEAVLAQMVHTMAMPYDRLKQLYMDRLYRRHGLHPYTDEGGAFMAHLTDVQPDGHLLLQDEEGTMRRYAFKEVAFSLKSR